MDLYSGASPSDGIAKPLARLELAPASQDLSQPDVEDSGLCRQVAELGHSELTAGLRSPQLVSQLS
jgi:hypothetical protein